MLNEKKNVDAEDPSSQISSSSVKTADHPLVYNGQLPINQSSQSTLGSQNGVMSSNDLIKNTIKLRLEILCKVLHGKGM